MKIEIRQRDKRALVALGTAVALFLLADQVLFPAYDWLADAPEAAMQREDELSRYRIAAGRQGVALGVLAQVEEATARLREQLLPSGPNTGGDAQGVRLETLIEAAAEDAGIVVRQRDAIQTRGLADGAFEEVSIGLGFDALPEELAAFLERLRGNPTHLAVTRLQVTPIDQSVEVPEDRSIARELRVTMTVAAVRSASQEVPA